MGLSNDFDTRVLDSLNKNKSLDEIEKKDINNNYRAEVIPQNLDAISKIYKTIGVEYKFDDLLDIIQNLNVVDADESKTTSYDRKSNTLVFGKSEENREFNIVKSFLQLTSQQGLIAKLENGKEVGTKLNDLFTSYIVTLGTGFSTIKDEDPVTPINVLDKAIGDTINMVGLENLVDCYAYGEGKVIFDYISERIGRQNAEKFYRSIDEYELNKLNEIIYDLCILKSNQKNEENVPQM